MSQNLSLYKIMLSCFHKSIAIACHLNNKHVYICDNMLIYALDTFIHSFRIKAQTSVTYVYI
jgi:hypothetical protein